MPAAATEAEVETMLQAASAVWRTVYNAANSASPNYRAKEQALFALLKGSFAGNIQGASQAIHGDFASAIRRAPAAVQGLARAWAEALNLPGSTIQQIWPLVYRRWVDESKSVNSREMNFGDVGELSSAVATIQHIPKADHAADTNYDLYTKPNGDTHAVWFDVTGTDTEPAGSQAADASTRVNISGATDAASVAALYETALNGAAIGLTADDSAGGGAMTVTVDEAGFEGNTWTLADFVADVDHVVTTFAGGHDGTNATGDGAIYRLTTDRHAFDIEACTAEIKAFECVRDAGSGVQRHEEEFEVRGRGADVFGTDQTGSGVIGGITAKSARHSLSYLLNPSFDSDAASASPTQITGWTVNSAIGNYEIVSGAGNFFRTMPGVAAADSKGLKQTAADKITQVIRIQLDPARPYLAAIRIKPSSADGNAILRVGSNSKTLALSGLSTWQTLILDRDEHLWYDQFAEDTLDVEIEWTGTTGEVIWDDLVFSPMDYVDGTWWFALGGATPWSRSTPDILTVQDTEGVANAIIQWFLRQAGLYLPGNQAGGETLADPSL